MSGAVSHTTAPSSEAGGLFSSPEKRTLVLSLGLIFVTLLAYYPVAKNGFINFDDRQYITDNSHINSGLHWYTVKWAFVSLEAANWHPLTWLSHALDYQLFGLNPAGHHLVSVLFHAANVILLFLLFQTLSGSTWRSLLVAALFAVHPLNVESVAWAAERKNVLSMFFFLLTLIAYCGYVRSKSVGRFLATSGFFACALMSKPQVISLPFVLLLLDYWPLNRMGRLSEFTSSPLPKPLPGLLLPLLVEKVPWFALSFASGVVTLGAQHAGNAVRTMVEYSLASRVETAVTSYIWYLRDVFFPWHLAPIYPHSLNLTEEWKVFLSAVVLVGISVSALIGRQRAPYCFFGWFWFLGTLVPMIGLVQVGEQARADRYMYIPAIGVFVLTVWGTAELLERTRLSPSWRAGFSVVILAGLSVLTYHQIGFWKNSETLWNYTLSVTKNNFMAEDNLAQELATQGRTEEALVHFHRILNLHNWRPSDLIAFGMYEQRRGYTADAIRQYQHASQIAADAGTRATALSDMGSAYIDLNDEKEAEQSFKLALQIEPSNFQALIGSGLLAQKRGELRTAIQQYTMALELKPSDLGYELLGRALEKNGDPLAASHAYEQARILSPNYENTRSLAEHLLQ